MVFLRLRVQVPNVKPTSISNSRADAQAASARFVHAKAASPFFGEVSECARAGASGYVACARFALAR